jgi:hypothetical protein
VALAFSNNLGIQYWKIYRIGEYYNRIFCIGVGTGGGGGGGGGGGLGRADRGPWKKKHSELVNFTMIL